MAQEKPKVWVQKEGGKIVTVYHIPQPDRNVTELDADHPEVVAFLTALHEAMGITT